MSDTIDECGGWGFNAAMKNTVVDDEENEVKIRRLRGGRLDWCVQFGELRMAQPIAARVHLSTFYFLHPASIRFSHQCIYRILTHMPMEIDTTSICIVFILMLLCGPTYGVYATTILDCLACRFCTIAECNHDGEPLPA